jgi:hypothetical protein
VKLCMDIMLIDKVPFLVTVSKYIKYITVRHIKDRSDGEILDAWTLSSLILVQPDSLSGRSTGIRSLSLSSMTLNETKRVM